MIIIEIQNAYEIDYFLRILFGISKVITEYLKEGEAYSEIKKVISVNIIYFDIGQGRDYIYRGKTNFKGIHQNDELELSAAQRKFFGQETIADLYPEIYLLKVNQFDDLAKNSLDEWIYFFKNSEIKDSFSAKGLVEADQKLRIANLPDDERKSYERYLDGLRFNASMAQTIKFEAEQKAEQKVEKEVKKTTVKIAEKMKAMGFSNDEIVKATNLT